MDNQDGARRSRRVVAVEGRDQSLARALRPAVARAGWELRIGGDPATNEHAVSALLVTLASEDDWHRLELLADHTTVVALLALPTPAAYRRAFSAGASGVAALTDTPAHIVRVLQATLFDYALVPLPALREERAVRRPVVADAERALLRGLAEGLSTQELAARTGCSERTVYRRLRRLRATLQVRGREEAVVVARRLGLLSAQLAAP